MQKFSIIFNHNIIRWLKSVPSDILSHIYLMRICVSHTDNDGVASIIFNKGSTQYQICSPHFECMLTGIIKFTLGINQVSVYWLPWESKVEEKYIYSVRINLIYDHRLQTFIL